MDTAEWSILASALYVPFAATVIDLATIIIDDNKIQHRRIQTRHGVERPF